LIDLRESSWCWGEVQSGPGVSKTTSARAISGTMPAVNVAFRLNGVVVLNSTATGSKYSWKLPKKENITIRIPKKLAKKREPSPARRESSLSRRHPSPARSQRAVQEDVISEADIGSDDEDNSDLSDLPSDDSEGELLPQSDKKKTQER